MSMFAVLVVAAVAATVIALMSGISSMAFDGEVAHRSSAQWMVWRVVFQAIAFLLIAFSLYVLT